MSVKLKNAIELLESDAFAATFQSMAQYRRAILNAISTTKEELETQPATVATAPAPSSEATDGRHFKERSEALMNAFDCMSDLLTHYGDWSIACSRAAEAAAATGNSNMASYWQHQLPVLDRMKNQAQAALKTGMFCLDATEVPNGSWLWGKLMDWCKLHGIAPSTQNALFAICGEAHQAHAIEAAKHEASVD